MKNNFLTLIILLSVLITGCGNSGAFVASNSTQTHLKEGNYQIKAINVVGTAESAYLIGVSHSLGVATQSFGLIPLKGNKTLYKDAREDLWRNYTQNYSSPTGKSLALINVEYDADTINYLFYTKARVTITADIIEFE